MEANTDPDTDPDPIRIQGFNDQKLKKNNSWKKNLIFFGSKTAIYLSLGLHKVCPGYRRILQLTKEAIQHFKTWIFSTFVGHFCPPGSGSGSVFKLRIRIQWSDWIRIQSGSGSETLPCWGISQLRHNRVVVPACPATWLAGRYDNPMPEVTFSPSQTSMNLATEVTFSQELALTGHNNTNPLNRCSHLPLWNYPSHRYKPGVGSAQQDEITRARTFKCLWGPGIDSKEWIPPAYVAWRAGTKTLFLLGA